MEQIITTTSKSWRERFKYAISGLFFGPLFGILGFIMIYSGEKEHAETTTALKLIENEVKDSKSFKDGDLVHIFDTLHSKPAELTDPLLGLSIDAVKLYRNVQSWQWAEIVDKDSERTSTGGENIKTTHTYQQQWSNELINSDKFKFPKNHQNPKSRKYHSSMFSHESLFIGTIKIDDKLYQSLLNFKPLSLDKQEFKTKLKFNLNKGKIYNIGSQITSNIYQATYKSCNDSADYIFIGNGTAQEPQIGDIKIEYWYIPKTVYSIIGQKQGNEIKLLKSDSLFLFSELPCNGTFHSHKGYFGILKEGIHDKKAMFKAVHRSNDMSFLFMRIGGLLFTVAAFAIFGYPLQVLFSWLPFIGEIWEKLIFKLMMATGTLFTFTASLFFFVKYNSIKNLTIWDLYYVLILIFFVIFVNNLRASVSSGGKEIYSQQFQ